MRTLSRKSFIILANIIWFAQFGIELVAPQIASYLAWRRHGFLPDLQIGCFRDSYYDSLSDRLYIVGALWLLSAPLMTAIALKRPRCWPQRVLHSMWNRRDPGLSIATLLIVFALALWPLGAAINAPVSSMKILEGCRAATVLAAALYYRAMVLSAVPQICSN